MLIQYKVLLNSFPKTFLKIVELVDWNIADEVLFKLRAKRPENWNILLSLWKVMFYKWDVNIFRVDLRKFYNCF